MNQFYSASLLGPFALCMSSPVGGAAAVVKHSGAPGFPASSSLISHLAGPRKPPSPLRSSISNQRLSTFQQWLREPSSALLALSSWICAILDRAFFNSSTTFFDFFAFFDTPLHTFARTNPTYALSHSRHSFPFHLPACSLTRTSPFDLNGHLDIACSISIPARLTVDDNPRMSAQPCLCTIIFFPFFFLL